ncbi:methyl-accepting chemotaxis protein [Thiomicrorhabdus chilensis]|uniref:methyl-accepting chemotaxis protein n=1 Tax=Thiomicrorhabdus chilensis TaxID=63656 RepID=UPI0004123DF0|nr:methyl-accepting chemotaxis protein [Thiomicrorhabdus chilensis]
MPLTWSLIILLNLALGGLFIAIMEPLEWPHAKWLALPFMVFGGLISAGLLYKRLTAQVTSAAVPQQTEKPAEPLDELMSIVESGDLNSVKALESKFSDEILERLTAFLSQHQQAGEVLGEVIESIKNADFGGQLTLGKAQEDISLAQQTVKAMAQELLELQRNGASREKALGVIKAHLEGHPNFLACWSGWEPNAYDSQDDQCRDLDWYDQTGRFMPFWGRSGNQLGLEPLVDYDVPGLGDFYLKPLHTKQPQVVDPYMYPVGDEEFLITSVVMPIIDNGKVLGVAGIDISLSRHLNALSENLLPRNRLTVQSSVEAMLNLKSAIAEVTRVMFFMANGEFTQRIDKPLPGDLQGLKQAVNDSVSALESAMLEINGVMLDFSKGDLSKQIEGDYQGNLKRLKSGINSAIENLHSILAQTAATAETVVANTRSLEKDNQNLNARTQQQAASLEETAASMEELTQTIRNTAQESGNASELVGEVRKHVQQGAMVVNQTQESMGQIHQASQKIADIVKMIDGISFQTNLLALNAAVEAARAGEHGRGFAVVAGEVRNLALRASQASNEIKDLVEQNLSMVDHGQSLSSDSARALQQINENIDSLVVIVKQISSAADQEMSATEQVNQAVSQLDQFTQENAALADQSAQLSGAMSISAKELQAVMASLKL